MEKRNLRELLTAIIAEQTTYLQTYEGKIVDIIDAEKKGRVLCLIPALGWDTNDLGAWCYPSDKNALVEPQVNDWVRVGFMYGERERPFYFGVMTEIEGMLPKEFSTGTDVLYESNDGNNYIKHAGGTFDLVGSLLNLLGATESFVLGDTAKTELDKDQTLMQTLQTAISGWTPVPNDGGAALKTALAAYLGLPQASYTNILSTKIKGE